MLKLERVQAAEGRALLPHRRHFAAAGESFGKFALDQLVKMAFESDLEVAWRFELVECRGKRAFALVVEPAGDEVIEFLFLLQALQQGVLIIEADRWRRRFAVDEKVRLPVRAVTREGVLELVLRAGVVTGPVRTREAGWQPSAETRPK